MGNPGRGGAQPGAGRPKGSKNPETIQKEAALAIVRQRIAANADRIIGKQLSLVEGCQYLYVIRTDEKGKKMKAELVKDESVIRQYLDGDLDGLSDEYYYITTERPDNNAAANLLDRVFGRPQQAIDHTTNGESINPYAGLDDAQLENLIAERARRTGGLAGGEGTPQEGGPAEVRPAA